MFPSHSLLVADSNLTSYLLNALQVTKQVMNMAALKTNLTSMLSSALQDYSVESLNQVIGASLSVVNDKDSCQGAQNACSDMKTTLLTYLKASTQLQDQSEASVQQQSTLLASMTSSTTGLESDASQSIVYDMLDSLTSAAGSTGLTETAAKAIGSTISSLFDLVSVSSSNDADDSNAKSEKKAAQLMGSMDNLLTVR